MLLNLRGISFLVLFHEPLKCLKIYSLQLPLNLTLFQLRLHLTEFNSNSAPHHLCLVELVHHLLALAFVRQDLLVSRCQSRTKSVTFLPESGRLLDGILHCLGVLIFILEHLDLALL